jgi:hypothetical protein
MSTLMRFIQIDKVLMLSTGILFDFLIDFTEVLSGDGGVVATSCLHFLVTRKGDWRASDPLLPIIPALTNRGFTGHEHIDEMGLIHMNG